LRVIAFMLGIYNYIPQSNHDSIVYNVAALLWLQYIASVMLFLMFSVLYFYIREFGNMCAVPNTAVDCSSLMS
jgi:uncharacterized protein (DUF486 family)